VEIKSPRSPLRAVAARQLALYNPAMLPTPTVELVSQKCSEFDPLPEQFNSFIINSLKDFVVSCLCGVRMDRYLILAHLHSGNPSYTDPIKSRLMVSVTEK
jgi:hypothetical protein